MNWKSIKSNNKGPGGRWGHASTVLDDQLYVFGGYDGNYLNDFYSYDFDNNMWQKIQQIGQIPEQRSNHLMFNYNGKILISGGGGQGKNRYGDIYEYSQSKWIKYSINLIPRTYHTGCICKDKLFIYGGESGKDIDDLEIIDLNNQTLLKVKNFDLLKPEPRRFSTLIYQNQCLVLIGGCTTQYQTLNTIYVAEIEQEDELIILKWKQLNIQIAKWAHSCIQYDDLIYIFGGRDDKDSNELYQIDITKNQINTLINQNQIIARRKHCASVIGNSMVIFGGFNGKYQSDLCFYELPLIHTVPLSIELPLKPYEEVSDVEFENQFLMYDSIYFYNEYYDCLIQTAQKCYGITKQKLIEVSGYFRELFAGGFIEGQMFQIDFSFVESVAFGIVLLFSYKRSLVIPILSPEELFQLLQLCDYLDMIELKQKVQYYIAQTVDKNTIQFIYNLSIEHQNNQLQNFCAYKVSQLKMPLQEIDNIQIQQINKMKKIRKLSLVNDS